MLIVLYTCAIKYSLFEEMYLCDMIFNKLHYVDLINHEKNCQNVGYLSRCKEKKLCNYCIL